MNETKLLMCLKGMFKLGHTENDTEYVSAQLAKIFPDWRLVCVWAFEDMWGFGGDSCIYAEQGGDLYEFPLGLYNWLYDSQHGPELLPVEEILKEKPGKRVRKPPYRDTACNWSWRKNLKEELN